MAALLLLLSALALGAAVVRRAPFTLFRFEAAAAAAVLGLFGWTWLAFVSCLVLPYRIALPLTALIAAGAALALWLPVRSTVPAWRNLPGRRDPWLWRVTTAVLVLVLGRLFWTHSLMSDPTGVYSAGSTWADFGLHSSIITHLAEPASMPMDLPVASGEHLTYPFLIDLLSAVLLRTGMSLHVSLLIPGLLLAIAFCQLLLAFALRLFDHLGAAVAGLVLVLTTGTAAGTGQAWSDWRASGQGLGAFLADLPTDYTVLPERNGNVTNLVANAMLPQRSILFGLGVALVVFVLLHAARAERRPRLVLGAGVLVGLLPMAHPHSFLVCLGVLAVHAADCALREKRLLAVHLGALAGAVVLAAPQVAWQQLANGDGTGGRVRWAWMRRPDESVLEFWWTNFGLMGLVFLALPVLLARPGLRHLLVWYLPFVGVLVISQLYAFQPFEYDNLKLLYYVYVMAGLLVAYLAALAVRGTRAAVLAVVPLALVVALPGALSITREFQLRDEFASTADVALADWVRANTRPGDVFLSTDRPNNPVATLGGRAVVLGYRGWLYNFSVPYAEREAAVRAALAGRVDDPAVRRYAPDYLLVAANEGTSWTVARDVLAQLPVAYLNSSWAVYPLEN